MRYNYNYLKITLTSILLLIIMLYLFYCKVFIDHQEDDEIFSSVPKIKYINSDIFKDTRRVYVIPGGGSIYPKKDIIDKESASNNTYESFYPEWTKRRTSAAFERYKENKDHGLFLCLSAGSLNKANPIKGERIIMESMYVIEHLKELKVPSNRIYGDPFSW